MRFLAVKSVEFSHLNYNQLILLYFKGKGNNIQPLAELYRLYPNFIHKEFVHASNWCKSLGLS
jgi:EAL and modified HD-GYP domain-containing signal transduction protein